MIINNNMIFDDRATTVTIPLRVYNELLKANDNLKNKNDEMEKLEHERDNWKKQCEDLIHQKNELYEKYDNLHAEYSEFKEHNTAYYEDLLDGYMATVNRQGDRIKNLIEEKNLLNKKIDKLQDILNSQSSSKEVKEIHIVG